MSQERPRFTGRVRNGRIISHVYDRQNLMRNLIKFQLRKDLDMVCAKMPDNGLNFRSAPAYHVSMTFHFKPAKRHGVKEIMKMVANEVPCTNKNDVDNLAKFYLDAANQVLFHDDKMVSSLSCEKVWGIEEKVIIEISPFKPKENL